MLVCLYAGYASGMLELLLGLELTNPPGSGDEVPAPGAPSPQVPQSAPPPCAPAPALGCSPRRGQSENKINSMDIPPPHNPSK